MGSHLLSISNSNLNEHSVVHLVTLCEIHLIFLILKAHKDERRGENVASVQSPAFDHRFLARGRLEVSLGDW